MSLNEHAPSLPSEKAPWAGRERRRLGPAERGEDGAGVAEEGRRRGVQWARTVSGGAGGGGGGEGSAGEEAAESLHL